MASRRSAIPGRSHRTPAAMIFTHGRWIRCREEVTINLRASVGSTDALKGLRAHQADQRPAADGDPQCGQADSIPHADDGPAGVAIAHHWIGRQCKGVEALPGLPDRDPRGGARSSRSCTRWLRYSRTSGTSSRTSAEIARPCLMPVAPSIRFLVPIWSSGSPVMRRRSERSAVSNSSHIRIRSVDSTPRPPQRGRGATSSSAGGHRRPGPSARNERRRRPPRRMHPRVQTPFRTPSFCSMNLSLNLKRIRAGMCDRSGC